MPEQSCTQCGFHHQQGGTPCKGQIRAQLWKILDAPQFVKTRRLRHFLTFLVEMTLNNAQPSAFTETALYLDFDSLGEPDAIARWDCHRNRIIGGRMVRIKARLASYYANQGGRDRVEIYFESGNQPISRYRKTGSCAA